MRDIKLTLFSLMLITNLLICSARQAPIVIAHRGFKLFICINKNMTQYQMIIYKKKGASGYLPEHTSEVRSELN
jgi:glycerophosphoryl diester phosphodiesterase